MNNVAQEEATETLPLRTGEGATQPSFRLLVASGPDAGKSFVVDGSVESRVLIGTGSTCHLRVQDRAVSRRHLAVSLRNGGLGLEDLGSTNGTFVGTLRVREATLTGGEEIAIADTRIRVERVGQAAAVTVSRVASFGRVVGASVAMRRIYPTLARLAESTLPVLIEGEAGTGKELVAEAIHEQGARRDKELVVFDASSIEPHRVEALLFGTSTTPGAVEQSKGGTLIIDDPSELPAAAQVKLARYLELRPVARDDGSMLDVMDVRVIALSRSDVEREVQAGRLREDLSTVLGASRVELPPLREREGDVTLLATAFFRALAIEDRVLSPLTVRRFEAYSWPGNVRELKAAVVRAATTGDDTLNPVKAIREETGETTPSDLYKRVFDANLPLSRAREIIIDDFDRRFVRRILERHNGNVTHAAAASGLARRYFQVLRIKRGV